MDIDSKLICLKLTKAIIGLVQVDGERNLKKFLENMDSNHQVQIHALFINKKDGCKMTRLIIYIDDGGIFTDEEEK
jgi:hypothetical protein